MAEFVRICGKADLPGSDEAKEFPCGENKMVCVANVGGELSALDNVCLHRGGPLGEGDLEELIVTCPWHGWQYDLATGECLMNPKANISLYPVSVESEAVWVEV